MNFSFCRAGSGLSRGSTLACAKNLKVSRIEGFEGGVKNIRKSQIKVESVRIDGDEVVGRWMQDLTDFNGPRGRYLVEDFVNWPNEPADIERFTALYAPLDWRETPGVPDWALPSTGKEFRFKLDSWRQRQALFKRTWESLAGYSFGGAGIRGLGPDGVRVRGNQLIYQAATLESFLQMEIFTAPLKRFRICTRPGCETPYFIARHLKQQYCSAECAEWAQAEWKKQWWGKRGKARLEQRKRNAKAKRDKRKRQESERRKR
jgi:hypothetical protein